MWELGHSSSAIKLTFIFSLRKSAKQAQVWLQFQLNHIAWKCSVEMFDSMSTSKTKLMTKHTEGQTGEMKLCAKRGSCLSLAFVQQGCKTQNWVKKGKTRKSTNSCFGCRLTAFSSMASPLNNASILPFLLQRVSAKTTSEGHWNRWGLNTYIHTHADAHTHTHHLRHSVWARVACEALLLRADASLIQRNRIVIINQKPLNEEKQKTKTKCFCAGEPATPHRMKHVRGEVTSKVCW